MEKYLILVVLILSCTSCTYVNLIHTEGTVSAVVDMDKELADDIPSLDNLPI